MRVRVGAPRTHSHVKRARNTVIFARFGAIKRPRRFSSHEAAFLSPSHPLSLSFSSFFPFLLSSSSLRTPARHSRSPIAGTRALKYRAKRSRSRPSVDYYSRKGNLRRVCGWSREHDVRRDNSSVAREHAEGVGAILTFLARRDLCPSDFSSANYSAPLSLATVIRHCAPCFCSSQFGNSCGTGAKTRTLGSVKHNFLNFRQCLCETAWDTEYVKRAQTLVVFYIVFVIRHFKYMENILFRERYCVLLISQFFLYSTFFNISCAFSEVVLKKKVLKKVFKKKVLKKLQFWTDSFASEIDIKQKPVILLQKVHTSFLDLSEIHNCRTCCQHHIRLFRISIRIIRSNCAHNKFSDGD